MGYSPKQWRAISHYVKKNNLRPELSAYPILRFTSRETGESSEMHISSIEDLHTADKERAKREAREEARIERKRPKAKVNVKKYLGDG